MPPFGLIVQTYLIVFRKASLQQELRGCCKVNSPLKSNWSHRLLDHNFQHYRMLLTAATWAFVWNCNLLSVQINKSGPAPSVSWWKNKCCFSNTNCNCSNRMFNAALSLFFVVDDNQWWWLRKQLRKLLSSNQLNGGSDNLFTCNIVTGCVAWEAQVPTRMENDGLLSSVTSFLTHSINAVVYYCHPY